ncbi:multisubunit potassium/proton antiporter PhaG subunit [Panacagrimonas perspica]|uniref:Multisubunit potassium/proton antiporter PhaG subunit n=1 Tax=Panacagrimonas perspica TaxID=381431 RepID=A0A4V3URE5_9GAMM|nr:monovalent cation/H(+) antiporter subunit G [Panacagrimonas perspica]TDU23300.1 multisubunit potassium/proton antiporter PhaG subunit [Panacagrimonas perspica]THD02501.1 Na+/H+ antiporter subunit G [Panacagrimonas perspica]
MNEMPGWEQIAAAGLLIASGILVVISSIGVLRLPDFFRRMHPPALAYTLGSWTVTLAAMLTTETGPVAHLLLIPLLLAITVPVTTVLLARVALFRRRAARSGDTPPPVTAPAVTLNEQPMAER